MFAEEKKSFIDYLEHIKVEVAKRTNHHVVFEEYVIVPFFGFIILCFNLVSDIITLDALDNQNNLNKMQDLSLIERIGSRKTGYWKVLV